MEWTKQGYLFDTESAAQAAVNAVNAHYSVPISDGVTTDWTSCIPWGEQWAILYDESLDPVLGVPVVLPKLPDPDP